MNQLQRISMDQFVDVLRGVPESEFTQERILRRMTNLLLDRASVAPYSHFDPSRYTRNLVFRNELFEIMVVCWGVGQGTPIHNHDNQLGWLSIQKGMLSLVNYKRLACAQGGPGSDPPRCKAGSPTPVELEEVSSIAISSVGAVTTTDRDDTIHEIKNVDAFEEPAISVHVYSKPIDSCVIYDREARSCQRVQLSFYSEQGKLVAGAQAV